MRGISVFLFILFFVAVVLLYALFSIAEAEDSVQLGGDHLLPSTGFAPAPDIDINARGSEDFARGEGSLRFPLSFSQQQLLMLDLDGSGGVNFERGTSFYQGGAGLIWRGQLDPHTFIGFNTYVDIGAFDQVMGEGSLGVEFEHLFSPASNMRFGANGYAPFEDYGNDRDVAYAPRLGGDAYLSVGYDFGGARLDLFGTGFLYPAMNGVEPLHGGQADAELRIYAPFGLPDSVHVLINGGARYDNIDHAVTGFGQIGLVFALDGEGPQPRQHVAEVRRQEAFGSMFVPIEHSSVAPAGGGGGPVPVDLGCGPGNIAASSLIDFSDISVIIVVDAGLNYLEFSPSDHMTARARCGADSDCLAAIDGLEAELAAFCVPPMENDNNSLFFFERAPDCTAFVTTIPECPGGGGPPPP